MKQTLPVAMMWKKLLLYEQALIRKHGLEKYKAETVFVIMQRPKENCKHCYGRGWTGKDIAFGRVTPCGCVKGFGLRGIVDLKEDELAMDFDGNVYVAEGERDEIS